MPSSTPVSIVVRELAMRDVPMVVDWFLGTRLAVPQDVDSVWSRMLGDPKIVCRVGVDAESGSPVGFFRLDLAPDRTAEVTLVVSRVRRRLGFGSEFVRQILTLARDLGVHRLAAMVERGNAPGRDFFLAAGFEPVGQHTGEYERLERIVHTATAAAPLEIEIAP